MTLGAATATVLRHRGSESEQEASSLLALAAAFQQAAGRPDGRLMDELVKRRDEIALPATWHALQCLVGLACRQTGETPRSLLESECAGSPSDEYWRATIDAARSRSRAEGG